MEVTLNVYNQKGSVDKLYSVDFRSLRTGTVKRLYKAVEPEKLMGLKTADEVTDYLTRKAISLFPIFQDILFEVFPELTEEELDNGTEISEIAATVGTLIALTITKLSGVGAHVKKVLLEGGEASPRPLA